MRNERFLRKKRAPMGQTVQLPNGLPSCIRPGEILAGKYRLERELGRGAMGTVWSAMHLTLGQRVAIKLVSAEHAQSHEARARFSTEAKAAARLRSRHVVQVYDDGETPEGTPYIVMEYLEGESLEARIEREGTVPLVDAVRITGQVARALARAHAQGIVHRDLKPGNIFLARSDEDEIGWIAKVLDFGIAKVEEQREQSTTKTGTVLGTPLFMSPEQVRGASTVDHRADLYSLGMCFFNMITGRFAFDGESFGAILVAICTEPLPDLRAYTPWVSDSIALWFQRCCAREASARYQTADELMDALQAAVGTTVHTVNRRVATEEQLGPSGTLKGHSAPVSPSTRAMGADESGLFSAPHQATLASAGETATSMPPLIRTQPGSSSESTAVLTVPGMDSRSGRKRGALIGAAAASLLLLAALGFFFHQRRSDADTATPPQVATTPEPAAEATTVATVQAAATAQPAATAAVVGAEGEPPAEPTAAPALTAAPAASAALPPVVANQPAATATTPATAPKSLVPTKTPPVWSKPTAKPPAQKAPAPKPIDIGF